MKTKQTYNKDILTVIKEKYGYSFDYIRKSIRGDRTGDVSHKLKEEYDKLSDEARKAIILMAQKF